MCKHIFNLFNEVSAKADPNSFGAVFINHPEDALEELARAVQKLTVLEIKSRQAWDNVNKLECREKIETIPLEKAYKATKDVNEYWEELRQRGISQYIPELDF